MRGVLALAAGVLLSQAPTPGWANARLENFQLPPQVRIAGQYEIVFKAPSALADLQALAPTARASALKSAVLPEKLPVTDADVHALANAIAASVGGRSTIIFPASNGVGAWFVVSGVTEASVRKLAEDPRIAAIKASSSEFVDNCQ
ncbi:MAG TPA: hypothetical protein VGM84_09915 [Steroidobacteraceae bacterium]